MREIKFRAKRKLNGDWVYGSLVRHTDEDLDSIIPEYDGDLIDCDNIRVITNTIGQFTGLKDKNGKEIYEGDICWTYEVEVGNLNRVVTFDDGSFVFKHPNCLRTELRGWKTDYIEVIGNIHEHKHLLK